MRIIAGEAKGRRLRSPRGMATRPMMDRAREGLFSSLGPVVVGARVLDLYAGTGSLGLEALSRGAHRAVFVESDRSAVATLRRNVDAVGLGGEVVTGDAVRYVEESRETFDVVFVDPPYEAPLPSVEHLLGELVERLAEGAVVVLHRRSGSGEPGLPPELTVTGRRQYGTADITRLAKE